MIIYSCDSLDHIESQRAAIPDRTVSADNIALTKKAARVFLNDSLFSGFLIKSFEDGAVESKAGYLKGKLEGESIQYYDNGQLREKRFYKQNRKTDTHLGYWPNGQTKFEYHFKTDMHVGELKEWYASGQAYRLLNYTEGKEDGSQKMWEPDGKIRANYVVKDGHRYGLIGLKNCKSVTDEKGLFTAIAY